MIYRTIIVFVLLLCGVWVFIEPGFGPAVAFFTGIAALFRDDIHGLVGSKFISLTPKSKLIRNFENTKYSLISEKFINPQILNDLNGWISDSGQVILSLNIYDANESNRYSGNISVHEVEDTYPIIQSNNDEIEVTYQYIGCSISGLHIIKHSINYGGSSTFYTLLLVTISEDSSVYFEKNKPYSKKRLVIKKIGSIPLGDRYSGSILYKYGLLTITACSGFDPVIKKTKRVFIF